MSGDPIQAYVKYERDYAMLFRATVKLRDLPPDEAERALHWASVCQHSKSAMSGLVRSGMLDPRTRGAAHRIKNLSGADLVLEYLRHVRNADLHSEEHNDEIPNPVQSATLNVGGAIRISGSGSLWIANSEINGHKVSGNFSLVDGKPVIATTSNVPIFFAPSQVVLKPVADERGHLHKFPFELVPAGVLPEAFAAQHAVDTIKVWEQEIVQLRD